ncbi:hypothetical protein GGP41_005275 [Bipolaris sorokiniana]|uniref:Uncharacterized protein n=1 Tax=Cochliobolus sativus TaxID=45130 RepID=A0A8H5ZKL8_COCSA|nr:hypothetical protein GGP41_005275 [Bipolaris sorokiniana]
MVVYEKLHTNTFVVETESWGSTLMYNTHTLNATVLDLIVTSANTDDEVPVAFLCNGESRNLKELQLAVFLQASVQGQRLCKHYGFETINTVKFSRANYRLTRTEVMSVMI